MKPILILLCVLSFLHSSSQQNLVPNPWFEDYNLCPSQWGNYYRAIGWHNYGATPDYCNSCDTFQENYSVPFNLLGFQYAASGVGYANLGTYSGIEPDYREYIGCELETSLNIGTRYYYSLKVSPAYRPQVDAGLSLSFTDNIGILCTTYSFDSSVIVCKNMAHGKANTVISDTTNWTIISGSFVADSSYTKLVIGNFFDDANTIVDSSWHSSTNGYPVECYYYVDDVCLTDDSLYNQSFILGISNENYRKEENLIIYPNPFTDYVYIQYPEMIEKILVSDMEGRQVYVSNEISQQLNLYFLSKGFYLLNIYSKNNILTKKIIKIN